MPKSFLIHRTSSPKHKEGFRHLHQTPGVTTTQGVPVVGGKRKKRCSIKRTDNNISLSQEENHHCLSPEEHVKHEGILLGANSLDCESFESIRTDHDYFVDEERDKFFNLSQLAEVSLAAEGCLGPHRPDLTQRINEARDWLLKNQKGIGYKCGTCGKKYSTSSNLARHKQTHRSLNDKKAKKCHLCSKVYVSMPAFSMHMRTHNQTCICSICGKSFSRPWLLQGHLRTHTGERPYLCSICPKAFADKSNLRAHVQTHSKNKPYTCQNCGKAFALKSYLYKHEESTCLHKSTDPGEVHLREDGSQVP